MISKHVPANSFYHTCRYICKKPEAEVLVVEGVRGHDYKLMAEDFEAQQQLRPTKTQACFHAILSFYPGEKPSNETMKEIAEKYLKELGIVDTQYSITKQADRAHLHLHIVANMVNNKGASISDSWIGLRGKKVAQQLTQDYQLIPALEKNLQLTNLEALSHMEATKYRIYLAISDALPHCCTMGELEAHLLKQDIETQYKYKGQTQEKQGVSFKKDDFCFKGSQIDRKFSLAGLEKILGQQLNQEQKPAINPYHKPSIFRNVEKDADQQLGKKSESIIDVLFKDEYRHEGVSHELLEEAKRKKKKKSQRFRR